MFLALFSLSGEFISYTEDRMQELVFAFKTSCVKSPLQETQDLTLSASVAHKEGAVIAQYQEPEHLPSRN